MNKIYKNILTVASALLSITSYAQVTIHSQNFDGVVAPALPAVISSNTADWITDNATVPTCTVAGSSGANVLAGAAGGSLEEVVFGPFNASAFTSIKVSWNGFRTTGAPTLVTSFSTDGASYTSVAFTDVATDDAWHALSSKVSLPVAADAAPSLYIKLSYDIATGTPGSFIAFDDWLIEGSQSPVFYWNGVGNLNLVTSWGLNTDGTGTNPTNFTSTNQVFNIVNGTSATIGAAWTVSGTNAKVIVGDGTTWNPNFTVPSGFAFTVGSGATLQVLNNATLTLQNTTLPTTSAATFTTGSTVNYAQASNVNIIGVSHSNLTISGGSNKTQSGNLTVGGILNLNGSNLIASNSSLLSLTLNGTITGSGALQTSSNSNININGTGALGTVTFSSTTSPIICRNLVINRTSSGAITMGSDLKVNNVYTQTAGSVNLNGRSLTLNGASTLGSSVANCFIGSSTSSLLFTGSGLITNSLFLSQTSASTRTLKVLTTNRSLTLGNALELLDSIKVSGGTLATGSNLTLKSTASLKARVAEITGGGSVTGNITVETFVPGSSAGWRNLGPAGISGLTVSNWDGGSGSATGFAMSCNGCINDENSAGGSHFVSIQSDPAGDGTYTELTGGSSLTQGVGYWVYDANSLTTAIDVTQTNSGPIVTGNVPSGTGFMSNPYPSPISVDRLKTHTSITSVDVWNGASFTSFNGGIPSAAVIPMGQGFYANGATNITFQESDKVSFNTTSILKTASPASIGNVVQLQVSAPNGDVDKTYIRFHSNATTLFDNDLDAYKRYVTPGYVGYPGPYSKYTTIATVNSNNDYAINSLPHATTSNAVIPVKVKVQITGTYTISPIDLQNIPSGACVTLKDKLLNVNHDLRTGGYVCNINDTTSSPRFELTICADITSGINTIVSNPNSNVLISQDQNGAFVKASYDTYTKATISAFNVMGQKLMEDKEVEGKDISTYLNLNVHEQVIIIRVTTAKESTTKKIFMN